MAFKNKVDYFGLSDKAGIVCTSNTENRTTQTAEANGEDGFIVAVESFGEQIAPSNDYMLSGNVTLSNIKLGSVKTIEGKRVMLGSITASTTAGGQPTLQASGQQIEDNATLSGCTCTLPSITISPLFHAQTFGAFTLSGNGAHLTQSTFAANCDVGTAVKDGVIIGSDLVGGSATVTGTIQVSDQSYPTPVITPTNGWKVTAPLTLSNPNGAFPEYTFGLTYYLSAD